MFPVLREALEYCPDVVMVEVHSDPAQALCDKDQAVPLTRVAEILAMVEAHNRQHYAN